MARRQRLKRQQAERWVDSQDVFPVQEPDPAWNEPKATLSRRPAALGRTGEDPRERECQERHGMPCLQFEAWLQINGFSCESGEAGRDCRMAAKIEIKRKARRKARRQLELEDEARAARQRSTLP
jgi:hypothetical protein